MQNRTLLPRTWRSPRTWWLLLFVLAGLLAGTETLAQSCSFTPVELNFGTLKGDGNTDAQANSSFTCSGGLEPRPHHFRVCVTLGTGSRTSVDPRWLDNHRGKEVAYNIHADAARTQIIGASAGGSHPPLSATLTTGGGFAKQTGHMTFYGRVPGGQLVDTGNYSALLIDSTLRYAWSFSGPPDSCTAPGNRSVSFIYNVKAAVAKTCQITLATDLDFGAVASIRAKIERTAQIQVKCNSIASWKLSLGEGQHPAPDRTRRMLSGASNFVAYKLYKSNGTLWTAGSAGTHSGASVSATAAPTTVTLRGVVEPQIAPVGLYRDSVVLTLTY